MGTVRKTVMLTDQQERWIKVRIAAGDFTSDSEYIRELIRRDPEGPGCRERDGTAGAILSAGAGQGSRAERRRSPNWDCDDRSQNHAAAGRSVESALRDHAVLELAVR